MSTNETVRDTSLVPLEQQNLITVEIPIDLTIPFTPEEIHHVLYVAEVSAPWDREDSDENFEFQEDQQLFLNFENSAQTYITPQSTSSAQQDHNIQTQVRNHEPSDLLL